MTKITFEILPLKKVNCSLCSHSHTEIWGHWSVHASRYKHEFVLPKRQSTVIFPLKYASVPRFQCELNLELAEVLQIPAQIEPKRRLNLAGVDESSKILKYVVITLNNNI